MKKEIVWLNLCVLKINLFSCPEEHCSLVAEAFVYYHRNQLQKEKIWKVYFHNADICHRASVSQIVVNKADIYVVPLWILSEFY